MEPPSLVKVFATVVIANALESQETEADIGTLASILKCKDHLCRNILNTTYNHLRTYQLNSGKYEHSLQWEIIVKTANLWENARSYIHHHLGRDTWNSRDGTSISLVRIHMKR